MEKYIYNEQNGLWYELQGDYYLPCLKLAGGRNGPYRHLGASGTDAILRPIARHCTPLCLPAAN